MGASIRIVADVKPARRYVSSVQRRVVPKAQMRTVNELAKQVVTVSAREIRKRRRLKIGVIKKAMRVTKATITRLRARITARGRPISLKEYAARQTKRGVTVNITGRRKLWKSDGGRVAFQVKAIGGHIFARRSKKRLPIEKQWGPSIPSRFVQPDVERAQRSLVRDKAGAIMRRNLAFLMRRAR